MCMSNKEEDELIQKTQEAYTINEEAAQRIINAHPVKIKETNIPHDINLKPSERIARAKGILESKLWK